MPVMGFTKFERLFRAAAEVRVDRDDIKAYLDFVEDVIYDLLIIGQAKGYQHDSISSAMAALYDIGRQSGNSVYGRTPCASRNSSGT